MRKRYDVPIPKPTTNNVMVNKLTSSDTPNVSETPSISAVMTLDANATTKHTEAIISVHHHLYAFDQFFGFSGSSIVKVTSLYFSMCPSFEICFLRIAPLAVSLRYSSRFASRLSVRTGSVRSSSARSS